MRSKDDNLSAVALNQQSTFPNRPSYNAYQLDFQKDLFRAQVLRSFSRGEAQ
jgi:hypothetical protein